MIVDVAYHHYRLEIGTGGIDEDPAFGPSGSVAVGTDAVFVSCFTESGPVSLRILVGDNAPGSIEDGWRSEWEAVQDVTLNVTGTAEVRTWEGGTSHPPTGEIVRPGRWGLRFHARGSAKVGRQSFVETPLEEHLVLMWPAEARPGIEPIWDEVVGEPQPSRFRIDEFGGDGRVESPRGYYRLVWDAEPSLPADTAIPAEPGIVELPGQLVVATGPHKSIEVSYFGFENRPGEMQEQWIWKPVAEADIDTTRPIRVVDGTGAVPRRMEDPFLPPGHWSVQIRTVPVAPGSPFTGPGDEGDHMILVWPSVPRSEQQERHLRGVAVMDDDELSNDWDF